MSKTTQNQHLSTSCWIWGAHMQRKIGVLRQKKVQTLLPRPVLDLLGIWEYFCNTLTASQHHPYHHHVLQNHSEIGQHLRTSQILRRPLFTVVESRVEVEARPTIDTQIWWRFDGGIRTVSQNSHSITTHSIPPTCARTTTQKLSSISVLLAKSEGPTFNGCWMVVWSGSKANHCWLDLW